MIREMWMLLLCCAFTTLDAFPQVTNTNSLVISTTESSQKESPKESTVSLWNPLLYNIFYHEHFQDNQPKIPQIYEMQIETNVSNRFAKALITSKVKNLHKSAQEAVFSVVIPDQAFISGFVMEIDGKKYEAYVQEKEKAKKTYDEVRYHNLYEVHLFTGTHQPIKL